MKQAQRNTDTHSTAHEQRRKHSTSAPHSTPTYSAKAKNGSKSSTPPTTAPKPQEKPETPPTKQAKRHSYPKTYTYSMKPQKASPTTSRPCSKTGKQKWRCSTNTPPGSTCAAKSTI